MLTNCFCLNTFPFCQKPYVINLWFLSMLRNSRREYQSQLQQSAKNVERISEIL